MRLFLLQFLFTFMVLTATSQTSKIDSLRTVLIKNPNRIQAILDFGEAVQLSNPNELYRMTDKLKDIGLFKVPSEFQSRAFSLVANSYLRKNNLDSSIIINEMGVQQIATKQNLTIDDIQLYINLGSNLNYKGDTKKGLTTISFAINKLLLLPKTSDRNSVLGRSQFIKGGALRGLGLYDEALVCYQEATKYLKDNRSIGLCNENISKIYAAQKNYEKGIEYLKIAYSYYEISNSKNEKEKCLMSLIEAASHNTVNTKFIDSLYSLMENMRPNIDPLNKVYYYHLVANKLLSEKQYIKSLRYLDTSMQLAPKNILFQAILSYEKAAVYDSLQNWDLSEKLYLYSVKVLDSINSIQPLQQSLKSLSEFYYKRGEYYKSANFAKKYDSVYTKYLNTEKANALAAQEIKYETSLKEAKITEQNALIKIQQQKYNILQSQAKIVTQNGRIKDQEQEYEILQNENKISEQNAAIKNQNQEYLLLQNKSKIAEQNAKLKTQQQKYETSLKEATIATQQAELKIRKQRNYWLICGLLAALAIATFLWTLYQSIKKKNTIIKKQKQEILHSQSTSFRLIRSMFRQQNELELHAAKVQDNDTRLYAFSLLHDLLYNDDSNYTELNTYIAKLCEARAIQSNISITCDVDRKINLGADALRTIGIIVNELISNSIKHAFDREASGEIHIHISIKKDELTIGYKDNGEGLPTTFDIAQTTERFGLKYVNELVHQYEGTIRYYNNNGANFTILLKV